MGIDELSGGHPCFMGSTSGIGDSSLMGPPSSIAVGFSSKRVFSYSIPSVFFLLDFLACSWEGFFLHVLPPRIKILERWNIVPRFCCYSKFVRYHLLKRYCSISLGFSLVWCFYSLWFLLTLFILFCGSSFITGLLFYFLKKDKVN